MASIRKRQGRYHAQVRRKGHPSITRTFASKTSATKWVKAVETDMERGEFKPQVNMTVDELIKRYQKEIVPQHKGASSDVSRCRTIRRLLGKVNLADLTPAVLASYRDQRLKLILPSTLRRELTILSSAINTAIIEWNIPLKMNRCRKSDGSRQISHGIENLRTEKNLNYSVMPHHLWHG